MARNAVTKLYTAIPGGSTQGTDLHTWMAENLTALTVGALYTLGAGASERNWWTLTFPGGAEILVACPNGTGMYGDNVYVERENVVEGSFQQPLIFAFFPEGGAEAALANGEDPDTAGFKTYVQTTLGLREPSPGQQMLHWRAGSGVNHQLHVIEDDADPMVAFILTQSGGTAGNTHMSAYIAAEDMWDLYPSGSPHALGAGVIYLSSNLNATKTYRQFHSTAWDYTTAERIMVNPGINVLPWSVPMQDALAAGRYPSAGTGKYYARQLCLFPTNREEILKANTKYIKITGINMPSFNTKFGTSTSLNFIRIIQRFLLPWDNAQTEPT